MKKQGSLFPELDREAQDERTAKRREEKQRARDWLRDRDCSWLINHLLEHGPQSEHAILQEIAEEEYDFKSHMKRCGDVLGELMSLWLIGKLWRMPLGVHMGSGEESYLWGIRGVHQKPLSTQAE